MIAADSFGKPGQLTDAENLLRELYGKLQPFLPPFSIYHFGDGALMVTMNSLPKGLLYSDNPSVLRVLDMMCANEGSCEIILSYLETAARTGTLKGKAGQQIKDISQITICWPSQDEQIFYKGLGFREERGQLMIRLPPPTQEGPLAVLAKGFT